MLAWKLAVLVCAVGSGQGTVLLDFYSDSCGPCRMMAPAVTALEQQGYPIRRVNVDNEPQLAQQFGVRGIPCFVMLVNGQETDRIVGATTAERLTAMLNRSRGSVSEGARPTPVAMAAPASHERLGVENNAIANNSEATSTVPAAGLSAAPASELRDGQSLSQATVRLTIQDSTGHSFGSGTIVHCHADEALIVTCGHIFRESQGRTPITVTVFGPAGPKDVSGELLSFDLERDVALVAIRGANQVTPARVAGVDFEPRVGAAAVSMGCDFGKAPSMRPTKITAINKYNGPANIEAAGEPVLGRSGGGLFTTDGKLIAVCNAADPADHEGLYASLTLIHQQLDALGLSFVYQDGKPAPTRDTILAAGFPQRESAAAAGSSAAPFDGAEGAVSASTALEPLGRTSGDNNSSSGRELICIVRGPDGASTSDIYLIEAASAELLQMIHSERRPQPRHLTSLQVKSAAGTAENEPERDSSHVPAPRSNQDSAWRRHVEN